MRAAELCWNVDPMILSLAGYHRKNAYMIRHWQEYSAERFPKDTLLEEGRSRFFEILLINPIDYSALNGLRNILLFQGELDAAEFFVSSAITCAKKDRVDWQAKHDLELVRSRLAALLFCRSDLSIQVRCGRWSCRNHTSVRRLRFGYLSGWGEGEIFKLTWKENHDKDGQTLGSNDPAQANLNSACKASSVEINCGVADGDSLGFELKRVCS